MMHPSDDRQQPIFPERSTPAAAPQPVPEQTQPWSRVVPGQTWPASFGTPPQRKRSLWPLLLGTLLVGLLLGGLGTWQFAQSSAAGMASPGSSSEQTIEKVAARVRPSVVQINVQKEDGGNAVGSGVIIDKKGYIVTNNHVIDGQQNIDVTFYDGKTVHASLTGVDPLDDLAVIKFAPPKNITVAKVGDSSKLQVGQAVLAIGNPLGITQTVTSGIVSALGRTVGQGEATIVNAVQTDAAINPGNSGGALVDMQGALIGIPTLVPIDPTFNTPANGVGFAIPSNRVSFIVPQLIQSGKVVNSGRADLGVKIVTVDPALAQQNQLPVDYGALVAGVRPGSAADKAGLRTGDIIVRVDSATVTTSETLSDILVRKNPGQTVALTIYRRNQQMTIRVKLGELQIK